MTTTNENEKPVKFELSISTGPNDDEPPEWVLIVRATADKGYTEVPLTVAEARDFAGALVKAASYAEVQTIGAEHAAELDKPPAQNAAKPRTCRICQKPIDDDVANVPFLCAACYRELKS